MQEKVENEVPFLSDTGAQRKVIRDSMAIEGAVTPVATINDALMPSAARELRNDNSNSNDMTPNVKHKSFVELATLASKKYTTITRFATGLKKRRENFALVHGLAL